LKLKDKRGVHFLWEYILILLIIIAIIVGAAIYFQMTKHHAVTPVTQTAATAVTSSPTSQTASPLPPTTTCTALEVHKPLERVIVMTVLKNLTIEYVESIRYDDVSFKCIISKWDQYVANTTKRIQELYGLRGAHIVNLHIIHIGENDTVKITFLVDNRVWSNSEVVADFLWFLNAWGLDFIESKFKETNHGLEWRGVLEGVKTVIIVNVPPQPGPYKAWGEPYGHCHGHIWWHRKKA
jgi:hypothetical protein